MIMSGVYCTKCKTLKPEDEFSKGSIRGDTGKGMCRKCRKAYYEANKEKIKKVRALYLERNKEHIASVQKKWQENNKERAKLLRDKYYKEHKSEIAKKKKIYRQKNKDKIRKQSKIYNKLNRETINAKGKLYRKANHNLIYKKTKEYRHKYPNVYKAHSLVNSALKSGKLVKPDHCKYCDDTNLQAHHCDYNKPLEVIWLCPLHHIAWHAEHGHGKNR